MNSDDILVDSGLIMIKPEKGFNAYHRKTCYRFKMCAHAFALLIESLPATHRNRKRPATTALFPVVIGR